MLGCWRGYLSRARCRLAHGRADATATHCLCLASVKSRLVLPFWYRPTLESRKKAIKWVCVCVCVCVCVSQPIVSYRTSLCYRRSIASLTDVAVWMRSSRRRTIRRPAASAAQVLSSPSPLQRATSQPISCHGNAQVRRHHRCRATAR